LGERRRDLNDLDRHFIKRSLWTERRSKGLRRMIAATVLVVVAAGVGFYLWTGTNNFNVRAAVIGAPLFMQIGAPLFMQDVWPSSKTAWLHTVDVAGRLDELGGSLFGFPDSALRAGVLMMGARFLADQGRIDEASRLADRALQIRAYPD
jgi:hypothetical protein